jgi:20S proteasome subunit beta 6
MAYAQDDFCVFAADTRLSRGYSILHRNTTKIHKLTEDTYILTAGMYADTINLWQLLDREIEQFRMTHGKTMQSKSIACFLSRVLYNKRFFPFYTFNIVVGKESN